MYNNDEPCDIPKEEVGEDILTMIKSCRKTINGTTHKLNTSVSFTE